jgi:hypothetical protein
MHHLLPPSKELFMEQVINKLGAGPSDFSEKLRLIRENPDSSDPLLPAGVLLPLFFREKRPASEDTSGEFVFRLIKRSRRVSQAGDIACPGGILHYRYDSLLMRFITSGLIPLFHNQAGLYSRKRDPRTFRAIALFLANGVRESWEELRLNPFRIIFLGPLPSYSQTLFRRIIFPLVCYLKMPHRLYPNYEVESLVDIPVDAFFRENNYGTLHLERETGLSLRKEGRLPLPCLIYSDREGRENILWGATFFIIINFLEIAFGFQLPKWQNKRVIRKGSATKK